MVVLISRRQIYFAARDLKRWCNPLSATTLGTRPVKNSKFRGALRTRYTSRNVSFSIRNFCKPGKSVGTEEKRGTGCLRGCRCTSTLHGCRCASSHHMWLLKVFRGKHHGATLPAFIGSRIFYRKSNGFRLCLIRCHSGTGVGTIGSENTETCISHLTESIHIFLQNILGLNIVA